MERKRSSLRLRRDEEEEEEEDGDRRISTRKRRRVRYVLEEEEDEEEEEEDEEDEEEEEEEKDDDEEGEEDDEQPGTSAHNQRIQDNRLLTVTCGNKRGNLDVEKLGRGEQCIRCEGRWFSPPAFEDFAGKGSSRKWKTSIFYDNKPLQFWFEQGSLTTKGFKRRGTENRKQKKISSSNHILVSASEESDIQSAEETEEDDVKDEDWPQQLVLEAEEVKVGGESEGEVVDSGADRSKEEEDKMEKGEMEDEDMPAVDDNDNSAFEEREAKLIISTPEKKALQMEVKVIIKRLPEAEIDRQSIYMEHPLEDNSCKPLDEDAQNEEDGEHSGSDDTALTYADYALMSDPPITEGAKEKNGEEFAQSKERDEDGQREIKSGTGNFLKPLSAPATSSQDIRPKAEDVGLTSSQISNLSSSSTLSVIVTGAGSVGKMEDDREEREEAEHCGKKEKERRRREMKPEMRGQWIKGFEDCQSSNNEHLDMSRLEASGQPTTNTYMSVDTSLFINRGIKEESIETMCGDPRSESLDECKREHTDATSSSYDDTQLPVMKLETGDPIIAQASDITQSSDTVEAAPSRPSLRCDLDAMDLGELRREKIKMQIKVLKLQEEYYTRKIQELKK